MLTQVYSWMLTSLVCREVRSLSLLWPSFVLLTFFFLWALQWRVCVNPLHDGGDYDVVVVVAVDIAAALVLALALNRLELAS